MNSSHDTLFKLLRIALGDESDYSFPTDINWREVIDISFNQGVAAIAVDGLQKSLELMAYSLEKDGAESLESLDSLELEDLKYEWFGEVMRCESDYTIRNAVAKKLANMWNVEGITTVILKGTSFAQYYSHPEHRYSCDLDLFIGLDWKKGCNILERNGIDICYEVYKDAQFHIDNVFVECHRYLMPIRGNKVLKKFEGYLRSLLKDKVPLGDGSLFVPPLMFNALFCVEHARGHLLHEKLTLRQVCDWMLIRRQPIDWDEFWRRCDEFGLERFARTFDRLADLVEGKVRYEELSSVERRVVDEMLTVDSDSCTVSMASSFFKRRVRQFRKTLSYGWKYREFNDVSMPVALWRQVWTHFFRREVEM